MLSSTVSGLDDEIAAKSRLLIKNQRKKEKAREFGAGWRAERLQRVVERVKVVENGIAELDACFAVLSPPRGADLTGGNRGREPGIGARSEGDRAPLPCDWTAAGEVARAGSRISAH
jgi:hypothetical protein